MSKFKMPDYDKELNLYKRILDNLQEVTNVSEFTLLMIFLGRYMNLLYAKIDDNTGLYCVGEHTANSELPTTAYHIIYLRNDVIHCRLDDLVSDINKARKFDVNLLEDTTAIKSVKMFQSVGRKNT